LIEPLNLERVLDGTQSPMFFGSAMTNFGVQLFLEKFCDMGTKPLGRDAITVKGGGGKGGKKDNTWGFQLRSKLY